MICPCASIRCYLFNSKGGFMKEIQIELNSKMQEIFIERDCSKFKLFFDKKIQKIDAHNDVFVIIQRDINDAISDVIFNCFEFNVVTVTVQDEDNNNYVLILRRKRG